MIVVGVWMDHVVEAGLGPPLLRHLALVDRRGNALRTAAWITVAARVSRSRAARARAAP